MIAMLMSYANKAFLKGKIADNIKDPGDGKIVCASGELLTDCLFKMEYEQRF
jgi:hypothetical protein